MSEPQLFHALVTVLPPEGAVMTPERRSVFMRAFESFLVLLYPECESETAAEVDDEAPAQELPDETPPEMVRQVTERFARPAMVIASGDGQCPDCTFKASGARGLAIHRGRSHKSDGKAVEHAAEPDPDVAPQVRCDRVGCTGHISDHDGECTECGTRALAASMVGDEPYGLRPSVRATLEGTRYCSIVGCNELVRPGGLCNSGHANSLWYLPPSPEGRKPGEVARLALTNDGSAR